MRCARELFPESKAVSEASMWSRHNRACEGPLAEGALCPAVDLLALPKGLGLGEDGQRSEATGVRAAAKAALLPPTVCAARPVASLASHARDAAAASA